MLSLIALATVGCGARSSSTEQTAADPGADLPKAVAATIADIKDAGDATVTRAELQRAVIQTAAADGLDEVPPKGSDRLDALTDRALASLLQASWVEGEAEERDVSVSESAAARRLRTIQEESFDTPAEFEDYLRKAKLTLADVTEKARLELLFAAVTKDVRAHLEPGDAGSVYDIRAQFKARWRNRTVCAPDVATSLCSNGPAMFAQMTEANH